MRNSLKLCALFVIFGFMFGCAAKKGSQSDDTAFHRSYQAAFDKEPALETRRILTTARSAIGTPYVRGGTGPGGFDCSGLVRWAYKSAGIDLPRSAREQALVGTPITRVEDMREGDIVAFRHPRRGYHTGIYVGDGKFIHSPRRRLTVRITALSDPYFINTFLGARRVNLNGDEAFVAEAQSRLNDYTEQKAVRELTRKGKGKAGADRSKSTKDGKAAHTAANGRTVAKKPVKTASGKENVRASAEKSKNSASSDRTRGKAGLKNSRGKTDNS
ncbi:MAG: C40 family peptidase [Desulfovibrio sp.]|jgi:hypothetical protein|nr:C40 family peptidase [Desulfovibrio sp.]